MKNLFDKQSAKTSIEEVVKCPECGFKFSSEHDLKSGNGQYECPACRGIDLENNIENLSEENKFLKEQLRRIVGIAEEKTT